jgi:hypothetical protein
MLTTSETEDQHKWDPTAQENFLERILVTSQALV